MFADFLGGRGHVAIATCSIRYVVQVATPRREQLVDAAVDYVFEHGVSDLSLRPLAEALGTSSRMLIYHFATKDLLLVEVLKAARVRQYQMLDAWVAEGRSLPDIIRLYWSWATAESSRPYMRLFFEVFGMAVQSRPGTEEVLPALSRESVGLLGAVARRSMPDAAAAELARLSVATLRGLLFEWLCGDDVALLTAALERFLTHMSDRQGELRGNAS
jgi:AcrR family transcriptional regulator